jgi:hypothetical protein
VDVSLAGAEIHSALLPGILESFFSLNGAGVWNLVLNAPAVPGRMWAVQTAVVDPAAHPDGFALSAAFSLRTV